MGREGDTCQSFNGRISHCHQPDVCRRCLLEVMQFCHLAESKSLLTYVLLHPSAAVSVVEEKGESLLSSPVKASAPAAVDDCRLSQVRSSSMCMHVSQIVFGTELCRWRWSSDRRVDGGDSVSCEEAWRREGAS